MHNHYDARAVMIKKISIVLLLPIIVFAMIVAYFLIGSIDDKIFDDQGLYAAFEDVDEEDNGFLHIAYTQDEKFKVYDSRSDATFVKHFLEGSEWDQAKVDQILKESEGYLQDILTALEKPYFRLPELDDVYAMPIYSPLFDLARLLLLKAVDGFTKRDMEAAVEYFGYALAFSQAIQSESGHSLISYHVGQAMQGEVVDWISRIVAVETALAIEHDDYNVKTLEEFQLLLDGMPVYFDDGYKEVFANELRFAEEYLKITREENFSKRWGSFKDEHLSDSNNRKYKDDSDEEVLTDDNASRIKIDFVSDAIHTISPGFYMHRNALLNQSAVELKRNADLASGFCDAVGPIVDITFPNVRENGLPEEMNWRDVFASNLSGHHQQIQVNSFNSYFIRRCFTRTELEAVKATIAIGLFEHENRERPEKLEELVPEFIDSLPIDYFNGQPLGYSKDKAYLYSVGSNFIDNGGSDETVYHSSCYRDINCSENPTFLIKFSDSDS